MPAYRDFPPRFFPSRDFGRWWNLSRRLTASDAASARSENASAAASLSRSTTSGNPTSIDNAGGAFSLAASATSGNPTSADAVALQRLLSINEARDARADTASAKVAHVTTTTSGSPAPIDVASAATQFSNAPPMERSAARSSGRDLPLAFVPSALRRFWGAATVSGANIAERVRSSFALGSTAADVNPHGSDVATATTLRLLQAFSIAVVFGFPARALPAAFVPPGLSRYLAPKPIIATNSDLLSEFVPPGLTRYFAARPRVGLDTPRAVVTHRTNVVETITQVDTIVPAFSLSATAYDDRVDTMNDAAAGSRLKTYAIFESAPHTFGTSRLLNRMMPRGLEAWFGAPITQTGGDSVTNTLTMNGVAYDVAPDTIQSTWPRGFGLADAVGSAWLRSGSIARRPPHYFSIYPRGFCPGDSPSRRWFHSRPPIAAVADGPDGAELLTNVLTMRGTAFDGNPAPIDTVTQRSASNYVTAREFRPGMVDTISAVFSLSRAFADRALILRDSAAVTNYTPAVAYAPPEPVQPTAIPDALITVYAPDMSSVLAQDVSRTDFKGGMISYEDRPEGMGAAALDLGLLFSEVNNRGYWRGGNIVEISTGDCTLAQNSSAGARKLYVDTNAPFDRSRGEDAGQAYVRLTSAAYDARIPVYGVGMDANGQYISVGDPVNQNGFSYQLPAYPAGSTVGRRRYVGRIKGRSRTDTKDRRARIALGSISPFKERVGTFTLQNQDVGVALYGCVQQFATDWPFISVSSSNFPLVGAIYSGTRDKSTLDSMLSDILSAITTGDVWVLRLGHDRTLRLLKLYDTATDTYTYNLRLPSSVVEFAPIDLAVNDEDTSGLYNAVTVLGDTDPQTKQPVAALVLDTVAIALYKRQIDAAPVTNQACKTVADCVRYGRALLNQQSLATAQNGVRVITRVDRRDVENSPGGTRQGDVVRAVQNVLVTRIDTSGTGLNWIPDSEFYYVGAIWTAAGATPIEGAGLGGSTGLRLAADGAEHTLTLREWVDVAPGSWWNLSAYIDAGSVQSGSPGIRLLDRATGIEIARVRQAAGIVSTVYSAVQIPDGCTRVVVQISNYSASSTLVPNTITISRPQFSRGTGLAKYERNQASPPVYGLVASVMSTIQLGGADGLLRYQDVKFAAIEPDWTASIAEKTNAIATALSQNRATLASIESFCVSPEAFPPTWDGLIVHVGAFAALFGKGTSPKIIGNVYFMLVENETNWVWLSPDGSFTVQQDATTVPGAIFYAIFQTSASNVLGYFPKASVGISGIGAAAVASRSYPAPVLDGDPLIVSAFTPYPTDANIEITAKLRDVPVGAIAVVVLYRQHVDTFNGQTLNAWIPDQEVALVGAPVPDAVQVIDPTLGQMQKGRTYDFALQYKGAQTYGLISDPIGNAAIKQNGFVAQTLVVTAQYLIGADAYIPNVTDARITVRKSPDNINAAIEVVFRVTNQPTNHSLRKIRVLAKSDASSTLIDCFALPAVGLAFDVQPSSGSYAGTAILPIGSGYTFYASAEDVKGQQSNPVQAAIGSIDAQNVVLDPAQLSQKFQNIFNSAFYGLTFADSGELVEPPFTEIAPSQRPFTISLVQPSSGNVDSAYDTTQAITFRMRARSGFGQGDPGRLGMVFFADANPLGNAYNNGFLVQAEPDGIGIYRKIGGNYTNLGYFTSPQAFTKATLLDGVAHELKVIVSPVLRTERYLQTYGSAGGQSRSIIAGLLRFTIHVDGSYYCALDYQTNNTSITGYCGPRNSSPQPIYIDRADFDIRVGASTISYNELDPVVRGVIASPIDVAGQNRPSSLQAGTVGNYQTIPTNGANMLYNPNGSRNLSGWDTYGSRVSWSSAGYYGGSFHGLFAGGAGRIDEVLQQFLTNKNNNGPVYTYSTYTASGRVFINNLDGTVAVDCIDGTNYLGGQSFTTPGQHSFEFTFTTKNVANIYFRLHFTGNSFDAYFFALQLEPGNVATLFNDDATAGVATVTQLPGGGIDLTNGKNANYNMDSIPSGYYGKIPGVNITDGRAVVDFNAQHINKNFDALYGTVKYSQQDPGSVGIALSSVGRVTGPGASVTSTGSTPPQSFVRAIVDEQRSKNQAITPPGTFHPEYGYYMGAYKLRIPSSQDAAQWFVEFDWRVYGVNANMTVIFGGPITNYVLDSGQANAYYNVYQDYVPDDNQAVRAYKMFCGSSFSGIVSLAQGDYTDISVDLYCDCSNELVTYMNGAQKVVRATKTQTRLETGIYTLRASRFS